MDAYTAIPIHAESSPEEQFLNQVEYDVSTTFKTKDGVKIPPVIRSELFRLMGEDGHFRRGIQEVMKSVKDWESLKSFDDLRRSGDEVEIKKWHNIHGRLRMAQKFAEQEAYRRLNPEYQQRLLTSRYEQQEKDRAQTLGLEQSLNIRR